MKMLLNIDPIKSFLTSITSAMTGSILSVFTITEANTAFQHAAWTVAIVAGIVSIINGLITIVNKIQQHFKKHKPDET